MLTFGSSDFKKGIQLNFAKDYLIWVNFGIWDVRGGGWVDVLANGSANGPDVPTVVFYGASTAFGRFDERLNDEAVLGRVAAELYVDRAEVKAW